MLDIYRGLKDYGSVMAALEDLRKTAADDTEKYRLEYEIATIYFEMADYAKAAQKFKETLSAAVAGSDRVAIRDAYAKALFRAGDGEGALAQFDALTREEPDPLRAYVDGLMAFYCKFELGKAAERQFPQDADQFLQTYEKLSDAARGALTSAQFATATWIYYAKALMDLKEGRVEPAIRKLNAVASSPDDFLAADAAYRLGMIYMEQRDYDKAREVFEHLLFATRSAESAVRATFALGQCLDALGQNEKARERFAQLAERYPFSPYVERIGKNAKPSRDGKPSAPPRAAPDGAGEASKEAPR
jgi:TolA-binding protein